MRFPISRRTRRGRGRRPAVALAGLLPLLALACGQEPAAPAEVARPVKIFEVSGRRGELHREYPGKIRAAQQADMAFEVPGRIIEFPVKEGQKVAEGELLARLDPRDYQAAYDAAKSRYDNARVNYDRAQKLFESGALAALERDRRKTVLDSADAELRSAKKALEDTELRAPFAGVMARKLVEDFENVQAKQPVLILQDSSHLELRINVPERDLAAGRPSESLDPEEVTRRLHPRVVVSSLPDREFPARVKQIARIADPTTRTFEATLVFDNPKDNRVLPGMTAKVIVSGSAKQAGATEILIPVTAVFSQPDAAPVVWVVDPKTMKVKQRPVTLGELTGSQVEVTSGLEGGEWLAVSGVQELRDGMTVKRFER